MSGLIISVSGLRGIVGEDLIPEVAIRYVAAFAANLPPGPVVVGRDGRATGGMIRDCVTACLAASGREVIDGGVLATPTVGVLVRQHGAAGAVQISASHNPPEYNGIKLFGGDGRVIGAADGAAVRLGYERGDARWVTHDQIGSVARISDPHAEHLRVVLKTVNVDAIRQRHFRVLLDSNHGAGGLLGMRLLEELGCDVVATGAIPDGLFEHPPEPTAENLAGISAKIAATGCDIGFCQDPDADRLALVDHTGHYIGEEYTVALCVQHRLAHASRPPGAIVINCATSGMTERLASAHGAPCSRSAVGEANVADMMIAKNAIYGGEGNGGPIDPRVGYVRDSFVGMAQVLDLMAERGQSLSDLAAALPSLAIHKSKIAVPAEALPRIFDAMRAEMNDATADHQDGLRLVWDDAWLLIRGSNTEPIVRMIAEAPSAHQASALCERAARVISALAR